MSVLISGAGIAGPALAHWLHRAGFAVTVVERAPALRTGGSAVDFRGAQVAVLDRMGILDDVRARQTGMGTQTLLDERGEPVGTLPSHVFSGQIEIARGDLTRLLYERTEHDVEYVFGDEVTSLTETGGGVEVTLRRGAPRTVDLVVGADGTHSAVRRLVFGDESRFREDSGYYVATFDAPNHLGLDHAGLLYNAPGRAVMLSSSRDGGTASVAFVFASRPLAYDRGDLDRQREIVAGAFAGVGWQVPTLIGLMREAPDLFFDAIGRVDLDRYSRGRVALLGDAAWSAGPGGGGTGLAMIGAYTLAGELATTPTDHAGAFDRYERQMRPGTRAAHKQAASTGRYLAPPTAQAIRRRNRTYRWLSARPLAALFAWMTERSANVVPVRDYPALAAAAAARHGSRLP